MREFKRVELRRAKIRTRKSTVKTRNRKFIIEKEDRSLEIKRMKEITDRRITVTEEEGKTLKGKETEF